MDNQLKRSKKRRIRVKLVGERLRATREMAGIGQRELAHRLGFGDMTIYTYEHNKSDPLLSNIIAIAKELNVSIDYLCGLSDDPNPRNNQKLSDSEQELVSAWRRGDMDVVLELFRQQLKAYRDGKRGVSVKPAVNHD